MPSLAKKRTKTAASSIGQESHIVFYPMVVLTLVLWILYRRLFDFPVLFDETIGKALFFGFPVWLYINMVGAKKILETMSLRKFQSGVLLGLAVGGIFGFATSILTLFTRDVPVQSVALFSSERFWGEFILALFTGFWETLLFFTFILTVIQEKYSRWAVSNQALLAALIFLIFHLPNIYLRFSDISIQAMFFQAILLFLFALGQSFLFIGRRNTYALILSHAIWGMVLLVHTW
jgi:hypothetical protein